MNRLGKLILGLIVLCGIGFAAMLRFGGADVAPAPPPEPAGAPAVQARSGPLAMPVAGIAPAAIADTFRDARGADRIHEAIDIMAPAGTPVLAAAGGTIEKLFESDLGGHTIYVRSPNKAWVHYYAHLAGYAPGLHEGMYVPAGTQIGMVGSSGDADAAAPHLHFEVKRMAPGENWSQGRAVNPYPLLRGQ